MNTASDTGPPPPPPPPSDPRPRLTRSSDDKVLTGLCGGLGRHLGVDPVVFRIAFVVLSLAGGSGVLLYLLGWALVPDDRTGAAAVHRVGRGRSEQVVAAVVAGIGIVVLLDELFDHRDGGLPVGLVLLGVGLYVLWTRREGEAPPPTGGGPTSGPEGATSGPGGPNPPPGVAPPPPPPPTPPPPAPAAPRTGLGAPPPVGAVPPPAPPPPTPRSALVPVTLSLLAVLAGGLALVDAAGLVDVSVAAGLALALLLVGGALLVGARWGRGRLLIPLGLLLSAALVAVWVVDVPLRGGVGERDHRPQTLVELDSPYRLAAGDLTVDLRRLDLAGVTSRVVASVGAGELLVLVPDDVALDVVAEVGAGELEVLHRHDEGLGVRRRAIERGREGQGGLVLRVRVGVGELEVRRAAA